MYHRIPTESTNNQKLILEYEKYQELLLKSQRMEEDYEQKLQSLEKSKAQELEERTRVYEDQLQESLLTLEQVGNVGARIGLMCELMSG